MKQLLVNSILPSTGKSRSERFILLTVAFLGLIGSMYMITKCQNDQLNSTSLSNQGMFISNAFNNPQTNSEVLALEGELRENSPIQFTLGDKVSQEKYILDLGNGDSRILAENNFYYSYNRPGNYKVRLLSMDGEKIRMVESRNVLISKNRILN